MPAIYSQHADRYVTIIITVCHCYHKDKQSSKRLIKCLYVDESAKKGYTL